MAVVTFSLSDCKMGNIINGSPVIGAMRVVAGTTVRFGYRIIQVLPFEGRFSGIVALYAQGRHTISQ